MTENYKTERGTYAFWRKLGFDFYAAYAAVWCFPEGHYERYKRHPWFQSVGDAEVWRAAEHEAARYAAKAPFEYRMDAKHPAFWIDQGYGLDEAAARAVAAIAMVNLQLEATPPPPPPQHGKPPEVSQTLLLQGTVQQRLEGPNSGSQSQEPFDPDDYPRLESKHR